VASSALWTAERSITGTRTSRRGGIPLSPRRVGACRRKQAAVALRQPLAVGMIAPNERLALGPVMGRRACDPFETPLRLFAM
jgi:hypothetical protein